MSQRHRFRLLAGGIVLALLVVPAVASALAQKAIPFAGEPAGADGGRSEVLLSTDQSDPILEQIRQRVATERQAATTRPPGAPGQVKSAVSGRWEGAATGYKASSIEARQPQTKPDTGAPGWWGMAGNLVLKILFWYLAFYAALVGVLLHFVAKILDILLSVRWYADVGFVQNGWKFVRDILNIAFVIGLLGIAFSTVAGLESFQARRAIPRLLMAALLVNFSLAIGGAINGVATCIMNAAISRMAPAQVSNQPPAQPLPRPGQGLICANGQSKLGTILVEQISTSAFVGRYFNLGPDSYSSFWGFAKSVFDANNPIDIDEISFNQNLAQFVTVAGISLFLLLFLIAIVVFSLLLIVRTVAILLLLVLSPIPYALGLIPGAQRYASAWWEEFTKYVSFGPVTILLLVLVVNILNAPGRPDQAFGELGIRITGAGEGLEAVAEAAFFMAFISAWLVGAMLIGQRMGVAFASGAVGIGRSLRSGMLYYGTGTALARAGSRALYRRTVQPVVEGYKQTQEQRARERAVGPLAQVGARLGGGVFGQRAAARVGLGMQARQIEQRAKQFEEQGLDLKQTNAKIAAGGPEGVAAAQYAVKSKLHEEMDTEELTRALNVLASAGRTTASEFIAIANRLREKQPAAGEQAIAKAKKQPFEASKVQANLNRLDAGKAAAAYEKDQLLRAMLERGEITLTENLVRGIGQNLPNAAEELQKLSRATVKKTPGTAYRMRQMGYPPEGEGPAGGAGTAPAGGGGTPPPVAGGQPRPGERITPGGIILTPGAQFEMETGRQPTQAASQPQGNDARSAITQATSGGTMYAYIVMPNGNRITSEGTIIGDEVLLTNGRRMRLSEIRRVEDYWGNVLWQR